LSPIVRFLSRRRVPAAASAIGLVVVLAAAFLYGLYAVAEPIADWINRAPQLGGEIQDKLASLRAPVEAVMEAEKEVMEATSSEAPPTVQKVSVEGPGIFASAAGGFLTVVTTFVVTTVLLGFLLASGDFFYAKLVDSFETLTDKKRALRVAYDVERVISRYLFTITLINVGLGLAVGTGMYFLGMPSPHIWGGIAALANFVPFIGAILGMAAAAAVALVVFDTLGQAALVPLFYLACTAIEGQFVTPLIVGRRLELNVVAVFISVAFWAWMWGIVGAVIAVPLLVIFKTFCDHLPSLTTIGNFLSGAHQPDDK
jgi:predicted PurR-regulated permease PerM